MGDHMSKPQIDTIKADAYCQLTVQDVSERLRRLDCASSVATVNVARVAGKTTPNTKDVNLSNVPEHLF